MRRFVIVGAGLAGHRAAIELRRHLPDAPIDLVGDEDALPYDRPPLSKDVLLGKVSSTTLKDADRYAELHITFHRRATATAIEPARRAVTLSNGSQLEYDALLLATGSRPRRLPEAVAGGVEVAYVRTAEDANRLRARLRAGAALLVIGGGFIGLEVAAAAAELGCTVTVIEAGDRLLARGLPAMVADHLHRLHEASGVRILTGVRLERLRRGEPMVEADTSAGTLSADVVVAGIGALPNVELAAAAGLHVADGIVVDGLCRTSDPHIFAAGEVTAHPVGLAQGHRRLESWKVAQAQPVVAAAAMAGVACEDYDELPWLWSDQHGCNLQMIGAPDRAVRFHVRGDPAGDGWTLVGLDAADRPVSGVAVNAGRDISVLRRAITRGTPLPDGFLSAEAAPVS